MTRIYPLALLLLCSVACGVGATAGDNEALGREGKVVFGAETKLAFTTRLVAGSTFPVSFKARDAEELSLTGAVLRSSDAAVLAIEEGTARLTLLTPGSADLEVVVEGAVVDAIALRAGKPGATVLVDAALLAASDSIDARLPTSFAIRTDTEHTLLVGAVDICGGDLIDLHASTIESVVESAEGVPTAIADGGAAAFVVSTQVRGDVSLVLKTPGLNDLVYAVQSVDPEQVDEVAVGLVSADEAGNVTLWGRAFVDDVELVGDLQLSWAADARVTLGALQGTVIGATVAFPADGAPPDERPANVRAEVFGEEGNLEVLTVTTATTTRGPPARELVVEEQTPSCGGGGESTACDPEAALLFALGLRRLRSLRLRSLRSVRSLQSRLPTPAQP